MCKIPSSEALRISALSGGAAEQVVRTISRMPREGFKGSRVERLEFAWQETAGGIFMAEGIFRKVCGCDTKVLLVIGSKLGLFLMDVGHGTDADKLLNGQHFSTAHVIGTAIESIEYVAPINQSILRHGDAAKINSNVRRAANEICALALKYPGELLSKRRVDLETQHREQQAKLAAYRMFGRDDNMSKPRPRRREFVQCP